MDGSKSSIISIHALLAESDRPTANNATTNYAFLSTLSLRRATHQQGYHQDCQNFLSTLSLRRATRCKLRRDNRKILSIHALLAESDSVSIIQSRLRSCFLSTLSLRRATLADCTKIYAVGAFYPRSPCGERRTNKLAFNLISPFLSTLSLRRATMDTLILANTMLFLSTLSLRRATMTDGSICLDSNLSIHALLAESDQISHFRMLIF